MRTGITKTPTLVILAAGLGSRFGGGGLKQVAPVDDAGHIIIDYSVYDAYRAGFRDVVCVINPDREEEFVEHFKDASKYINISYAHQSLNMLPQGFTLPERRVKPWGTAHAVLSAKNHIKGPFAVINADDFYGAGAYRLLYDFLVNRVSDTNHAMIGYQIENTLTESGYVARGVCSVDNGKLLDIVETTQIKPAPGGAVFTENEKDFTFISAGTIVSMSMWGFGHGILSEIEKGFVQFLSNNLADDPLKSEYFLPSAVGEVRKADKAEVEVIPTVDKWYGVTYAQDMPGVQKALAQMKADGVYPEQLWR